MSAALYLGQLRQECGMLEVTCLHLGLMTPKDAERDRPTTDELPDWWKWYGKLHRLHAKKEFAAAAKADASVAEISPLTDGRVLAAMAREPVKVALTPRPGHPVPREAFIHPKGATTLLWIHAVDKRLGFLAENLEAFSKVAALNDDPTALDFIDRICEEIAYQHARLAWVITTPGPRMPFNRWTRPTWAEIPEEWHDLDALDFLSLHAGYLQLHYHRLGALRAIVDTMETDDETDDTPRRPLSWATFMGSAAIDLGIAPDVLMEDWSLESAIAAYRLSSAAKVDAMARAKKAAAKRREDATAGAA